jgi:hypothetical protein
MLDFFDYIKKPYYTNHQWVKYCELIKIFLLLLLISSPITVIINVLDKFLNFKIDVVPDITYSSLLLLILIGPILEETLMRLLLKPNKKNIIFFIVIISIFSVYSFLKHNVLFVLFIPIIFIILFLFLIKRIRKYQRRFIKYFKFYFYLSAILFSILHIFNFVNKGVLFYLFLPIIILPYFINGLFFGYVRMKNNIYISLSFHIFINIIASLSLIFR